MGSQQEELLECYPRVLVQVLQNEAQKSGLLPPWYIDIFYLDFWLKLLMLILLLKTVRFPSVALFFRQF